MGQVTLPSPSSGTSTHVFEWSEIWVQDRLFILKSPVKVSQKKYAVCVRTPRGGGFILAEELDSNRLAGPFPQASIPQAQISRFGVIPKSSPGKWRLIVDLSHPDHKSVNDGIPKNLCSMYYITVDDAIRKILELGPGTELAKIDVKGAFRLIPVNPLDRHLLAMEWRGGIFIDTCLPFGLRSAPKLFNLMADLLEWILQEQGVTFLLHYLDDYRV